MIIAIDAAYPLWEAAIVMHGAKSFSCREKGSIARGGASPLVLGLKVTSSHFLERKCTGLSEKNKH